MCFFTSKLIKVCLLGSERYIYQNERCNDKKNNIPEIYKITSLP